MGAETAISWTDSTDNFWWGCTAVGPGCDACYAEAWAKRTGHEIWGTGVPRRKIASAVQTLLKLERDHAKFFEEHGRRRRVFIQSMSDLFDLEVPAEWFREAWQTIARCPSLDVQIVTKRIPAVSKRLAMAGVGDWPSHAGLMITVVNQDEAERDIPRLIEAKQRHGIPWVGLSMEPIIDRVVLPPAWLYEIAWVIVGQESGPRARPMKLAWPRLIRDQCAAAGVAFHMKQITEKGRPIPMDRWPEDLRIQEFPS